MGDVFDILPDEQRGKIKKASQPDWLNPMLATLTHETFNDPNWIYERKLDGERVLAFCKGGEVRLMSRNKKVLNDTYPEIVDAMQSQVNEDAILDGEIVAFEGDVTSFSRLQDRIGIRDVEEARNSSVAVYYYLFDVLHLAGHECTELPLRERKRLLREAVEFEGKLRFTSHRNEDGEAYLEEACRKGWEGLIAKRSDGKYRHSRSKDWLKFKCVNQQEFVIGGFTEPKGQRRGFGALIVGYYDDGKLHCAGKVGTGYSDDLLVSLRNRMDSRERKTSPFDKGEEPKGDVHWISPELVCEVGFTEWTDDGMLRHPRFLGLRRDKNPRDVHREGGS